MKFLKITCALGIILLIGFITCVLQAKSKTVTYKPAGLNGGFEVTRESLPANWMFYTSRTVSSGDFDIVMDQNDFKEGKQSLKFVVRKCSDKGGWRSPGFTRQFEAIPGETYTVSFWAKNDGSEFTAKIGGVNAFQGTYQTVVKSGENIASWQQFHATYTMPADMKELRWELNILRPGTFWIDDFRMEKGTNQTALH